MSPLAKLRRFGRNVLAIAFRELTVMRHDPALIGIIGVQPIIMILLLGYAISNKPANVSWVVLDRSNTAVSRRLVESIRTTGYFLEPRRVTSYEAGRSALEVGSALAMVVIPRDFAREAIEGSPQVQVLLDGADPLSSARIGAYIRLVAANFDPSGRALPARAPDGEGEGAPGIDLRSRFWFNHTLVDRKFFMATLAGMLLTNLCFSISALGLVGEREAGTYEQTLSLPTTPIEFVLGKLMPYVALSYVVLALSIVGPGLLFGYWPTGSWLALLVLTLPFVLASLAIGVLVSAVSRTSAQAVFLTVFFILPSMVLSGVMLPYQLMPDGVRQVGGLAPLRWYQIGLRRIITRGGGFVDVWVPILALVTIFAVMLALIRWRLRPRLG
jgi:ABC-2 type transport system permease protein